MGSRKGLERLNNMLSIMGLVGGFAMSDEVAASHTPVRIRGLHKMPSSLATRPKRECRKGASKTKKKRRR